MDKIEFTCPECGSHKIEEIMVDMIVASECSLGYPAVDPGCVVDPDGYEIQYGDQTNQGGHVERYQCGNCGFTIVDDSSDHADDGLDEHALVKAIQALNAVPSKMGDRVTHTELVQTILRSFLPNPDNFDRRDGRRSRVRSADSW